MRGFSENSMESPLHVHGVEEHGGSIDVRDFEMKVTGVYGNDATKRQVAEAVQIHHARRGGILNRQDEWRQIKLPRINLSLSYWSP